ncbi:MAG: class I SAM-dependent methyltransferase, partial [Chloroflexi bacterium]|nr:class I SAM-dependent methyltransferase [Chloroflexota bacterium]
LGLDFSQALLDVAKNSVWDAPNVAYACADFADSAWDRQLPTTSYDLIFSFAVFHHLPGKKLRQKTIKKIASHMKPGGQFIHSHWQFLNSAKLQARIQPWSVIGLNAAQVDEGDYLLDWRRGGYGLRYIHHTSVNELESLAAETGFRVIDCFYSDGAEGNLGLYQIWEKHPNF